MLRQRVQVSETESADARWTCQLKPIPGIGGWATKRAFALAVEVENLAHTYIAVRALGPPKLLADDEMMRVLTRLATPMATR